MKNKLEKILAALLVAVITLCSFTTSVNAAAKTLKLGNAENIQAYVAGTYFTTKTTASGKYVYCLNIHKDTAKNITSDLVKTKDSGFAYILKNGYPNKSFTGERLKDYYILNKEKLEKAKEDLCIMHPLPRVNEISTDVDDDKRACYFKQAKYGKYIRMALILSLLEIN